MQDIILLDIDDCIFPSNQTHFGTTNDALDILEINCKRLNMICSKFNLKIQIISSWSNSALLYEDNQLIYPEYKLQLEDKEYYKLEYQAFLIIKKYLEEFTIEISSGNKEKDIKNKIQDNNFRKVIVIEDTNFSHMVNKHNFSYYIETLGFITNNIGYKIKEIIENQSTFK